MAIYTAGVTRNNISSNAVQFLIDLFYGGTKLSVLDEQASGRPVDASLHEIVLELDAQVPNAGRAITHSLDQYDHDTTHLYAKVTVLFNAVPAWLVEIFAQPDTDPTTPHVYWASCTRIDASAPVSISSTVN